MNTEQKRNTKHQLIILGVGIGITALINPNPGVFIFMPIIAIAIGFVAQLLGVFLKVLFGGKRSTGLFPMYFWQSIALSFSFLMSWIIALTANPFGGFIWT